MKFAIATYPGPDKSRYTKFAALLYAGFITIMLITQLYSFEDFIVLMRTFGDIGGSGGSHALAATIVCLELLSLPFLLRMKLSTAMRTLSMISGWLIALFWLEKNAWALLTDNAITTIGYFGNVIDITPGFWSICLLIDMIVLSIWVAWGRWPITSRK